MLRCLLKYYNCLILRNETQLNYFLAVWQEKVSNSISIGITVCSLSYNTKLQKRPFILINLLFGLGDVILVIELPLAKSIK